MSVGGPTNLNGPQFGDYPPFTPKWKWSVGVCFIERPVPPHWAGRPLIEIDVDSLARVMSLTRLGKAEVGQKTLLDVLDPVQRLLATSGDGADVKARARQCALDSAAATANMDATRGRASFLGDRALGHVDPGSRSMALIIVAICDSL